MKDNKKITNWIKSIIINTIIMVAVLLLTKMTYETNDDYVISARIAGGYPYVGFVNYYLCKPLIAVQAMLPGINVYVLFLIAASFISFIYVTKIILDKCSNLPILLTQTAVLIIFSFDHYCAIQFTKTAALLLTTGFIALADCVIGRKGIVSYIAALLLIYTGASTRYEAYFLSLGIFAAAVIVWMFTDRKNAADKEWFKPKKLASSVLIIVLIFGPIVLINMSDEQNNSTEELRLATEYNLHRSNIIDFPTYEYYDQNKAEYEKIGISKNDLYLIDKWFLDYDGAASLDNLKKIDAIERPQTGLTTKAEKSIKKSLKYVVQGVKNRSSSGIHILILSFLSIIVILTLRPRRWLFVIAMGAVTLGVYVAIHFIQRVNYRVLYIADIGAAIWIMYYYAFAADNDEETYRNKIAGILGVIILIASIYSSGILMHNCNNKYERAAGAIMTETQASYFKEHGDTVFVWATGEKKMSRCYVTPLKAPDRSDDNVFNTGSWTVLTPFVVNKLENYGMKNPIKDLIDNDGARFIGSGVKSNVEEYLTKWYATDGGKIQLIKDTEVDGLTLWKVKSVK